MKGSQRKYLRGLAHALKPVVQVGKSGLAASLFEAVDTALRAHELIKVKFVGLKEHKVSLSKEIAMRSDSEWVGMIGNVAILYRQHPEIEKRKIVMP